MSVLDKINELFAGDADYDKLTLLREARDELTKSRTDDPLRRLVGSGDLERMLWRYINNEPCDDVSASENARQELYRARQESALAQAGEGVPPDMVLVAREPTPEVIGAMQRAHATHAHGSAMGRAYAAMLAAAPAAQGIKPGWGNDYLLDLMGEWDCPLPTGMFNQLAEKLNAKAAPPVEVDEAMVERLRTSLWSTWGANRQTTDWPDNDQLRTALAAALKQGVG